MRHLMPIVTPRLVLRPPTLGDLDSIQTAKQDAWPDLQRWMAWAFDNQRSRQAMENSIRRTMDYQSQAGIALAGFHRINGDFVVRTALDVTDEPDVYETGYWVAPKYAGQGMATEAANAAIRYGFGHLGAKAISIGYFDGNEPSRRIVEKLGFEASAPPGLQEAPCPSHVSLAQSLPFRFRLSYSMSWEGPTYILYTIKPRWITQLLTEK